MKICQICSAHDVHDGRIFERTCQTLAGAGFDVHLFAKADGRSPYVSKNVTIHPVPHVRNRIERIRNRYAIAKAAAREDPDAFHVHEPELLGPVIKYAGSRPVIWDVHEAYLDVIMDRAWIPSVMRRFVRMAWDREERQLLPRCAGVITATDEVGRRYRDLHPLCMTIKNFPKLSELTVVPFALRRPDTCVFTGTIKENRGIREALLAFRILARKGRSINFFIAGMCEEKYLRTIKEYIREFDIEPLVKFFGKLTHEESISLASYSTLGLIPHLPYGNNMAAWPVKMMEYLGLGLPVIYSDLPSHMEIAGPREVGMTVDARRPECIAEAIETMIDNPRLLERAGENARQRALEALDWGGESKKLLRFYRTILAPSGIHQPLHA